MVSTNWGKKVKFLGRILMFFASGYLLLPIQVLPLPSGGQVISGESNITQSGNQMTILQTTEKSIINWDSYSIDSNELVQYIQPNENSISLNRVVGIDPSILLGQLIANGNVWIINPNGILVGKDAVINVGGLLVSTLNISDSDFLVGKYEFSQNPNFNLSYIINKGNIIINNNGYAILVAPLISNEGLIVANLGKVLIGGTEKFSLNFDGIGLINFTIDKTEQNPGTVFIPTSQVTNIIREVVNTKGLIEAGQIVEEDGVTKLVAASGVVINTGTIKADGAEGQNAGTIILNSNQATAIVPGSLLSASGIGENSSGGSIYILSEGNTALTPGVVIEAKGGISGDGGFVEASAGKHIYLGATVDTRASSGNTGTFLIDPTTLIVANGSRPGGDTYTGETYGDFIDDGLTDYIYETELENATSNIVLQAAQNITVQDITDDYISISSPGISISMQTIGTGSISFEDVNDTLQTNSGNISISNPNGTISLGNLVTKGGNVDILAQYGNVGDIDTSSTTGNGGAITVTYTGSGNATFGDINTSSSNLGSSGGNVQITGGNVSMTIGDITTTPGAGGTAGTISIVGDTLNVGNILTGGGDVTIALSGQTNGFGDIITVGGDVSITGGQTYLINGNINTSGGDILISSNNGDIGVNDNIESGGGSITIVGGNNFVMAPGTYIDANVGSITISAGSGEITLYGLYTSGNNITITGNEGTLTFNDDVLTNNGQLIVTGHNTITQLGGGIDTGSGDITFSATGDIKIDTIQTTGTAVITTQGGSILETSFDAGADIFAGTIILTAGDGTLTTGADIDIDVNTTSLTATADNNIIINNYSGVPTTANLTSRVDGDIVFYQQMGDLDITAYTENGYIEIGNTSGDIIATSIVANNGYIYISNDGDVYVNYIEVDSDKMIEITSRGDIVEDSSNLDSDPDIVGGNLIILTDGSVGDMIGSLPLSVNITNIAIEADGDVYIEDTENGLKITELEGNYLSASGITAGGAIDITTYSPIIVNADVTSANDIYLHAQNADGYILLGDNVDILSSNGDIYLRAEGIDTDGNSVIMSSTSTIQATNGDVNIWANTSDSGNIIISQIIAGDDVGIIALNTDTGTGSILDDGFDTTSISAFDEIILTAGENIGSNTGLSTIPEGYLDIDITNSPSITLSAENIYINIINGDLYISSLDLTSVTGDINLAVTENDLSIDSPINSSGNINLIADNIYFDVDGTTGTDITTTGDVSLTALTGVIQDRDTTIDEVDIVGDNLIMIAQTGIIGSSLPDDYTIETTVNTLK
ncbi:MAG: filamentous hemagglutinin N-terminal domain-containing protein, partial [Candidatus Omnitrophica bacterium]|nr:filamentous hemagglutinin N-terminal domain-containing protein [Candidatus Omnitrophota bacterium]